MPRKREPGKSNDIGIGTFLRKAVDQGIQNVAIVDLDGTVIYCNEAFADAHGRTSQQIVGENVSIFHSASQMESIESINRSILKEGCFTGEVWHCRADGTEFLVRMSNSLIRDSHGSPAAIVRTFQDISDQSEKLMRIEYLNSVVKSLRKVDKLITQEKDASSLIRSTCDLLVDTGGYSFSWILLVDGEGSFLDIAESGIGPEFREIIMADDKLCLPNCASLSLEKPGLKIRSEINSICKCCSLGELDHQNLEIYAIRLEYEGEVFGVLSAGLPEHYGMDDENQLLFAEIAEDISYALHVIQVEKAQLLSSGALKESQLLLTAFLERFPGAAFIKDSDSRYLQVNRNFTDTFGSESRWIGKAPEDLFPEALASTILDNDRLALEEGYSVIEKTFPDKDGIKIKFEVHSFRIEREGKNPLIGGIGIDVTERSISEQALRESEERYRAVFENTGAATVIVSTDTTILLANKGFERISGYSREELCGKKSWREFVAQDDLERMNAFHQQHKDIPRDEPNTYELRFIDRAGIVKDVHLSVDMIPGSNRTVSSLLDITELKQTQERLKQSLHNTQSLLRAMPDMMFVVTTEGQILDFWVEDSKRLAMQRESVVGSNIRNLEISEPDMEMIFNAMRAALSKGRVQSVDYSLQIEGKTQYEEARFAPYESDCVIAIIRDITIRKNAESERRLLEAQIQHTQKLESLGVLAGGIAHDFNNILMAILGNADLATDSIPDTSPARVFLTEIANAATRAAELSRQMLAYSGRSSFEITPLSLNDVVVELTHMLEVSISKKAILKFRLAEKLPLIQADATQIRQILMNLITNASESIADRSGVISITTGAMHCDSEYLNATEFSMDLKEDMYVYIEVADTGSGMDNSVKSQLFDPFFTTKFTGRGLGLSAVLGIIRGHKGAIKVYSEPGEGSTFKVLFPVYEGDESPNSSVTTAGESQTWKGSGTILFADDEDTVLAVGRRMLEHLGFSVLTAEDGRQAVDIFRENSADIILAILDLTMPHLSGDEVYREIRRIRKDVPVIVSSGFSEQDISHRFAGKQLAGFIQKPYRSSELATKIREILDRESATLE